MFSRLSSLLIIEHLLYAVNLLCFILFLIDIESFALAHSLCYFCNKFAVSLFPIALFQSVTVVTIPEVISYPPP